MNEIQKLLETDYISRGEITILSVTPAATEREPDALVVVYRRCYKIDGRENHETRANVLVRRPHIKDNGYCVGNGMMV